MDDLLSDNSTVADIWRRSVLTPEAIARVIAHTKSSVCPISPDQPLLLAAWSHYAIAAFASGRHASAEECRRVASAFTELRAAMKVLQFSAVEFPSMPEPFEAEMDRWVKSHAGPQQRRRSMVDDAVYPALLAIFFRLFQRKPSSSLTGPTLRFVESVLNEMRDRLQNAAWINLDKDGVRPPNLAKALPANLKGETLRSKITRALPLWNAESTTQFVSGMGRACYFAQSREPMPREEQAKFRSQLESIKLPQTSR